MQQDPCSSLAKVHAWHDDLSSSTKAAISAVALHWSLQLVTQDCAPMAAGPLTDSGGERHPREARALPTRPQIGAQGRRIRNP